jgi:death-on-curing protein
MAVIYFKNIDEIIAIHQKTIIASGGGADGILTLDSLQCAIEQIQIDDYYPNFEDKLTHLFWTANKSHSFQDGNKRIAISICSMFLLMNGYLAIAKDFMFKMETISYHVAAGNIDKELLHEILTSILYEEDYNEGLKLKIFEAISNGVEVDMDESE